MAKPRSLNLIDKLQSGQRGRRSLLAGWRVGSEGTSKPLQPFLMLKVTILAGKCYYSVVARMPFGKSKRSQHVQQVCSPTERCRKDRGRPH